jgi:hypothetical protein
MKLAIYGLTIAATVRVFVRVTITTFNRYVPYGEVKMVMPYLIRRANENSSLAGGAARELAMIKREFRRRIFG